MKKKILIILGIIIAISLILFMVLKSDEATYKIVVSLVDDYSPDRILTVYDSKNEKIEVKRVEYLDGTILCNGRNMSVYFGDIKDEKEFKIILKDNSVAMAKIVEEEVKE